MSRDEIMAFFGELREQGSVTADLAFYAGRYMDRCDWQPFLKAVFERNPVTIKVFGELNLREVYDQLCNWPDESIYDGNRLALPDEVVNFQRGDGFEKALALMHVITSRQKEFHIHQNFYRGRPIRFSYHKKPEIPRQGVFSSSPIADIWVIMQLDSCLLYEQAAGKNPGENF
jgi:hypothetical protein